VDGLYGVRPSHGPAAAVFRTDLGREVFGGGGITPDVLVENPELTPFDQLLLARNAFLNFGVDYSNGHPIAGPEWRPGPELLAEFKAWLVKEGIATEAEAAAGLATDGNGDYARRMLAGEILNARFGPVAQHRALAEGDQQIQRALALFEQAGELLARREALDNLPPRSGSGGGSD
jgi:carboxyl-terminal processing protease